MKHPIVGITPKQALLVAAVFERTERSHHHRDLLFEAGRDVGLTRNETLLELDAIVDAAREKESL